MFEGKEGTTGWYSDECGLLTYAFLREDPPLSISSVLDGSDGSGDSAVLGKEDLRLSLSRLELRREDVSLCFGELGLMSDCSI